VSTLVSKLLLSQLTESHSFLSLLGWPLKSHLLEEASELDTREKKDSDDSEIELWKVISGEPGEDGRKRKKLYVPEFNEKPRREGSGKRVMKYVEKRKEAIKEIEKVSHRFETHRRKLQVS